MLTVVTSAFPPMAVNGENVGETSTGSPGKLWSQKLLEMLDTPTDDHRGKHLTHRDYLYDCPTSGYNTSMVDESPQLTVEPFEAVDCVVGAFGFEMEGRPFRTNGSYMQHPPLTEAGRGIKVEDNGALNGEVFLSSLSEYKYRHRCSVCSKLFRDIGTLRSHVQSKVCAIPMPCKLCPKTFFGKRRLQKHVYNCHRSEDSAFHCVICGKRFSKKDHLNRHMTTHTAERPFACPGCHRRYKGERQLECHMFTHHHEMRRRDNFPCDLCGRLFVRRETLESHACPRQRRRAPFVCDGCGTGYGTKHEVRQHVWRAHLNHLPHGCGACAKRFATPSELNQHHVVHQVERPFLCTKCASSFKTMRHLKQHSTMCLSEHRLWSCFVCGDSFGSERELALHKAVHSEGRHPCPLCENTYKKGSYLKQHLRRCHLEEKAFACLVCAKTFAVRGDLRQHAMVHSELRPYTCEDCGKCYKHKQALQRHATTNHLAQGGIAQGSYS